MARRRGRLTMARIRSIKPGFFASEDVSALPLRARLTWIGLWTHCDDKGRTKDNVKLIKAAVWPLDDVSLRDIEDDLTTLAGHGRIVRYEVAGQRYLAITNWGDHQRVNKPTPSKIPPPPPVDNTADPVDDRPADTPPPLREDTGSPPAGKGEEGKGRERSQSARAREARRWLHGRYGLTDTEAAFVLDEIHTRARDPIEHLIPYMDGMAEGDLADIVAAALDLEAAPAPTPGHPGDRPPWCGECDERTRIAGEPDAPRRCPACHPLRGENP
ncbi:hypothetical protein [Actinomadura formosensis]|uniref:hypothetical protein n=1 Tax=Actinomadura formosensis TaxID=60706 RepID=UPI003D8C0B6B